MSESLEPFEHHLISMLGCPSWSDRSNAAEAVCLKPGPVSPSRFRSTTEQVARLPGGMLVN
ncbi:MAG: hypothetical protein ACJ8BW_20075 [Ktedonobacteraceae bacterium]